MDDIDKEKRLEIIEVPPELQGPTDEEILKMSEKVLREVSGKRKKGERRPSKRARIAMKEQRAQEEAQKLAMELFGTNNQKAAEDMRPRNTGVPEYRNLPLEKQELVRNAFTPKSQGYTGFVSSASFGFNLKKVEIHTEAKKQATQPTPPPSGRVLKASFGGKTEEKPKAVIVSAADLARQRAEERAKKIREALMAKRGPVANEGPAATADGEQPVKRPRGRPRKNPLPEA